MTGNLNFFQKAQTKLHKLINAALPQIIKGHAPTARNVWVLEGACKHKADKHPGVAGKGDSAPADMPWRQQH
jgi:hypothetical protein